MFAGSISIRSTQITATLEELKSYLEADQQEESKISYKLDYEKELKLLQKERLERDSSYRRIGSSSSSLIRLTDSLRWSDLRSSSSRKVHTSLAIERPCSSTSASPASALAPVPVPAPTPSPATGLHQAAIITSDDSREQKEHRISKLYNRLRQNLFFSFKRQVQETERKNSESRSRRHSTTARHPSSIVRYPTSVMEVYMGTSEPIYDQISTEMDPFGTKYSISIRRDSCCYNNNNNNNNSNNSSSSIEREVAEDDEANNNVNANVNLNVSVDNASIDASSSSLSDDNSILASPDHFHKQ
ncbi:hypothetical protein CANARDRAFT_24821 [[Candida] arabinofermentans NRRL YB-2248]|uniref:Uncharacterized protein n=1 Tax=[Candida] arabinofermentans NRRL YB-2248 TaxID=983967 RepID=A0A1E4SVT3_9ASCO|nr:hypothetical protein CANARDRAFT_24821 [[Candida] arabinofermentans NRRL YB-2248]